MNTDDFTEDEREDYEERASIFQFEAGMSKEVAEREAWRDVLKKRTKRGRLFQE